MATKTLFDDDKTIDAKAVEVKPAKAKRAAAQPVTTKNEVAVVAKPPQPQNILEVIARASTSARVDVAKMKELRDMWNDEQARNAEHAYAVAMHAAQSKMPRIARDKKADRFKYATLENVSTNIDPIAREHGFVLSYGTIKAETPGNIVVIVDVMHTGGCTKRYESPEIKPDTVGLKDGKNKTDTQGSGASISYMRRYLKLMVFDVVVENEDTDAAKKRPKEDVPVVTPEEVDRLIDLCGAAECPRDRLLNHLCNNHPKEPRISKLDEMPKAWFNEAVAAIRNYEETRKQRAAAKATPAGAQQ